MEKGTENTTESYDSLKIKRLDSEQEIYQSNNYMDGNYNDEQNLN